MQLDKWMRKQRLSNVALGKAIGVSDATISRIRRGKHLPNWITMTAIWVESAGRVKPNDYITMPRRVRG